MKANNVLNKTKAKPKARKPTKKAATVAPLNGLNGSTDEGLSPLPTKLATETEEQRNKRKAALNAKNLKAFQMFYDTYHAGKSNWDF